jgi:hypothetical protein
MLSERGEGGESGGKCRVDKGEDYLSRGLETLNVKDVLVICLGRQLSTFAREAGDEGHLSFTQAGRDDQKFVGGSVADLDSILVHLVGCKDVVLRILAAVRQKSLDLLEIAFWANSRDKLVSVLAVVVEVCGIDPNRQVNS